MRKLLLPGREAALTEGRQLDEYTEISNDAAIVRIRKVRTGNGVRLEIHAPEKDRRVYLDPLNIESLAWQTPQTFSDTLEDPPETSNARNADGAEVEPEAEYTEFANEFAYTLVRKVRERGGARLEIVAPKLGYQILLDPPLLESLTWQTPDTLSKLIEEPYGPRGAH
ncbi:MAG TPA: hypothetical protein VFY54_00670 [Rubrobacter sp.]|nr:hypothetical protein [Rubrobacter sp.]